jgi:hypothetical protein
MDVQQVRAEDHPLYKPLMAAIHQAMFGKGERHGGASVPWLQQPIFHYAKMHGRAFLTGQAAKKLEEAASTRHGEAFITEVLGAIVYCGAALIREQQLAAERGEDRITFERKWPWLQAEPEARIVLKRQPEPLCEGSINAEKERATRPLVDKLHDSLTAQHQQRQGHDGPGGVIRASDPSIVIRASHPAGDYRDPAAWARYAEQRNDTGGEALGRFSGGRYGPTPTREMDAQVFATRCTCGTAGDSDTHAITCALVHRGS